MRRRLATPRQLSAVTDCLVGPNATPPRGDNAHHTAYPSLKSTNQLEN